MESVPLWPTPRRQNMKMNQRPGRTNNHKTFWLLETVCVTRWCDRNMQRITSTAYCTRSLREYERSDCVGGRASHAPCTPLRWYQRLITACCVCAVHPLSQTSMCKPYVGLWCPVTLGMNANRLYSRRTKAFVAIVQNFITFLKFVKQEAVFWFPGKLEVEVMNNKSSLWATTG
jgi:hypothetical protein